MKSQLNYENKLVEEDKDVDRIIQNAINGNWTVVWDGLDRKEYLINRIPPGRTWGVLHHAVYLGQEYAVKKLLSYPTCDPSIKTLRNPKFGPGETPIELTSNCHMINILKGYIPKDQDETQGVTEECKGPVNNAYIGTNALATSHMGNYGAGWGNNPGMNSFHSQNQNIGIYSNQTNYPNFVNGQTYPLNIPQMDYGYSLQQQNYGQMFQPSFNQEHATPYESWNQQQYYGPISNHEQVSPYEAWNQQQYNGPISNQKHVKPYEAWNQQQYNDPICNQDLPHTTHYKDKWSHTQESYPTDKQKSPVQVKSMANTQTPIQQKQIKQSNTTTAITTSTTNLQTNVSNHKTVTKIIPTSTNSKYPCDAELISVMVFSAKHGNWEIVWKILDNKPNLINCIPSDRAWSVLHQAVWHDNIDAVYILLSYPACDPEIKTKLDKSNDSGTGKKPIDLAKSEEIKAILRKAASKKQKTNDEAPTMLPCCKWENYLGECIQMSLSCCRDVLVPNKWSLTHHNSIQSISIIMQTIFSFINSSNNWIKTRDNVSLTVQQFCNELGNELWSRNELVVDSKEQFFKRVINLYTEETRVYSEMNRMLRLQDVSIQGHTTDGSDLSLGPYALLLNAILMYWKVLKKYTGKTYR